MIENGSWAPASGKLMRALLDEMKQMQVLDPVVTLKSALKEDSAAQLAELKDSLLQSLAE